MRGLLATLAHEALVGIRIGLIGFCFGAGFTLAAVVMANVWVVL